MLYQLSDAPNRPQWDSNPHTKYPPTSPAQHNRRGEEQAASDIVGSFTQLSFSKEVTETYAITLYVERGRNKRFTGFHPKEESVAFTIPHIFVNPT